LIWFKAGSLHWYIATRVKPDEAFHSIPTLLNSFLIRNGQLPVNTGWSTKIIYFEQRIEHPIIGASALGLYILFFPKFSQKIEYLLKNVILFYYLYEKYQPLETYWRLGNGAFYLRTALK
jgi:hypothetical protein